MRMAKMLKPVRGPEPDNPLGSGWRLTRWRLLTNHVGVFNRSNQTSELLEVILSGVEGHRSDPSHVSLQGAFKGRASTLQIVSVNISFHTMLEMSAYADICMCL